jgi:hypothetical protein
LQANRLVPLGVLAVLALAYVLLRPVLAGLIPHLGIWELPFGALVVAGLVLLALRAPPGERPRPTPGWRRHRQVVRALPDPEAARLAGPLERWARTGADAPAAAEVLARATGRPAESLSPLLAGASTERRRRALLRDLSRHDTLNPGA